MSSGPPDREDIERELEIQFAHADAWDRYDAYEGLAAVAGLEALAWITTEDAATWRHRFQRLLDDEPRPTPDPDVRQRCLELVIATAEEAGDPFPASKLLRHFEECGLITGHDHERAYQLLYGEHSTQADVPAKMEVHDVRLGPAARDGVRVIWLARIGDTIRVACQVQHPQTIDRGDAELRVNDLVYPRREIRYSPAATGHATFDAPPPGQTGSLRFAGVTFEIDLP